MMSLHLACLVQERAPGYADSLDQMVFESWELQPLALLCCKHAILGTAPSAARGLSCVSAHDKLQYVQGLAPFGHLADGRLHLVIVRKCSRLQFLHFLATIPSQGATAFVHE